MYWLDIDFFISSSLEYLLQCGFIISVALIAN